MTLSTLDTKYSRKLFLQGSLRYLAVSLVLILFGMIYEHFSHGVYSLPMIYAFLFPLAGGALPSLAMALYARRFFPGKTFVNLWNCMLATFTVGSIFTGVLEIYGTANPLVRVYWIAGALLALAAAFVWISERRAFNRQIA